MIEFVQKQIKTSKLTQLKTKYKTNNTSTSKCYVQYYKNSTDRQSFLTNFQPN